ncbi:MAG: SMP-30/gluconolactonase/LRE family protein [Treponemataceae bacterium]
MNTFVPEPVADYRCYTGEGPLWHPLKNRLYWLDIPIGAVYWHNPEDGRHGLEIQADEAVGGLTAQADGSLLLFMNRARVCSWDGNVLKEIIAPLPHEENTRFNDVIADPLGGVFAGTMSAPGRSGRLYRIASNTSWSVVSGEEEGSYGTPNGMGFTPDLRNMYFNDSRTNTTYRFKYDKANGRIFQREVFRKGTVDKGRGDGLTVDRDGNIWMGEWDGGRLVHYSPSGEMLRTVALPSRKVSACAFGGPDYRDLFITTALADGNRETEGVGAGMLFRMRTEIPGRPEFLSKLGL